MHHATNPTTNTTANQSQIITTEQFLAGLPPLCSGLGNYLPEPSELLGKLKAIVSLLRCSQDEETMELLISGDQLSWTLVLMGELIDEADERADKLRDHGPAVWNKIKKRLDACHLIVNDHEAWGSLASGKEV